MNSKKSQKLFLASAIDVTLGELAEFADITPEKTKVAFVKNAALPYGNPNELFWVKEDKEAFLNLGYKVEDLDISAFSQSDLKFKIADFDVIHVCGGNTLYLNYLFHKTGMHGICQELVSKGELIYTGSSAGSMIVSPDLFGVKDSLLEGIDEKYLEGIDRKDYFGLDLVPFLVIPHTNNPDFISENIKLVNKLPKYSHPLIFLRDNQAVLVSGGKFEIFEAG